jgi:hypothetical protein
VKGARAIRWSTAAVVVALAAVAAVVSYRHALEVIRAHGESGFTAYLVPLTVDGLIYASSMVLLDASRRGVRVPPLARWTLALGIVATLAANVAHGLAHGVVGAVVAAWPAAALVLSYELLMALIRGAAVRATVQNWTVEAVAAPVARVPVSREVYDWAAERDLFDSVAADAPGAVPADGPPAVDVPGDAPEADPDPECAPGDVPERDPLYPEAVRLYLGDVASGAVPPLRAIKADLGIGQTKAQQVQGYLRTLAAS